MNKSLEELKSKFLNTFSESEENLNCINNIDFYDEEFILKNTPISITTILNMIENYSDELRDYIKGEYEIDLTKEQMDYILRFITLGICYLEENIIKGEN